MEQGEYGNCSEGNRVKPFLEMGLVWFIFVGGALKESQPYRLKLPMRTPLS